MRHFVMLKRILLEDARGDLKRILLEDLGGGIFSDVR